MPLIGRINLLCFSSPGALGQVANQEHLYNGIQYNSDDININIF